MLQIGFLQTIQVGTPKKYGVASAEKPINRLFETSFMRAPTMQPRWLFTTHLDGSEQADKKSHGQLDQAVLLYAAAHYPLWQEELQRPEIGPGGFGENFTVKDLSEESAYLGDIYAIGNARICVTGPRYPCWKIACRWGIDELNQRVAETGRTGWYCSVVEEGKVAPNLPIMLVDRPYPQWSMALINDFAHGRNNNVAEAQDLIFCPQLHDFWRQLIVKRITSKNINER